MLNMRIHRELSELRGILLSSQNNFILLVYFLLVASDCKQLYICVYYETLILWCMLPGG